MSHPAQVYYCASIKGLLPQYFRKVRVLDIGSMDINGNNRFLFHKCEYNGIDIAKGKNVDLVCRGHELYSILKFDTIICTEVFEHDKFWKETILNAIKLLKPGGLFLFTCATTGRPEHGTKRTTTYESPFTTDYYLNVTEEMVRGIEWFNEAWQLCEFSVNEKSHDLRFIGIKKGGNFIFKPKKYLMYIAILKWFCKMRVRDIINAFRQRLKMKKI